MKMNGEIYAYDGFCNLIQLKTPSYDNKQVVKNFIYDGNGRVKAVQNPYFSTFSTVISDVSGSSSYANYTYDAMDRVTNVTNPDATVATVVFNRWLISTYDENSHRKDYQLDAYDRIVCVQEFNIDAVLDDGIIDGYNTSYAYDTADQFIQINDTYGNQFKFTYDSLGRRTRLNDPDVGEWNYTYDLAGNLVSQAGGGGNLVAGDGFYREYNSLNQLVRIRNGSSSDSPLLEQYYYDPFGERIKVWRNDTEGTTIYTPFREFMQVRNSSGVYNFTYVYDGSTLVARVEPDNSVHYYHPDHLGSTTLITDGSGSVVENTFYEPFGAVTSGGNADVKLYTGQFSDTATGQYYYGARYYLPGIGRYGQPDPIIQNVYNPQNLNRYSYVVNNPYKYIDPTGNIAISIGFVRTAGLGGGVSKASGRVATLSFNGIQFGTYEREADLISTPTLSGGLEVGIFPFQNSLEEFSGGSDSLTLDIGELISVGGELILPLDDEGERLKFDFKKFGKQTTLSIDINVPYLASLSLQTAKTSTSELKSISFGSSGSLIHGSFTNPRTNREVKLKPDEAYDPEKDNIVKISEVD